MIHDLQSQAWSTAEAKGFHEGLQHLPPREAALVRLALIHTEVSEATQEVKRHGLANELIRKKIACELADVLIRCADLAETIGVDLEEAVLTVLEYNTKRPYRYGTPDEARL